MSKILYKDLEKNLSSGKLSNIYFLYGNEKYLIKQIEKNIINLATDGKYCDFDFINIDGENIDMENVSICVNTYPLFSKMKCAVIHDINVETWSTDTMSDFMEIIQDFPDFSMLLISEQLVSFDEKKSQKWRRFINNIGKYVTVVELSQKNSIKVEDQIIRWGKERGKNIDYRLAQSIIRKCGKDLNNLRNEVNKLCCFDESQSVTEKAVNFLCVEQTETSAFYMCNSLMMGNYSEMYKRLDNLFDINEIPVLILSAISSNYIDMYRVKLALNSGYSASIVADYFDYKNKNFKIDAAVKNVSNMSINQIKESIDELVKADKNLKNSTLDPRVVIDFAIARLIQIRKGSC